MKIKLSEHFSYGKLLRFTAPCVAMLIFMSIYSVVDGFFVSNFVGKTSFAALNFIMPFLMIISSLGYMLGAGGSALIAKTMGEGDTERANRYFSLLVYLGLALGFIFATLGIVFIEPVAALLGAEGQLLHEAVIYGKIILSVFPLFMMQMQFQSFFVTAEKPMLGLIVTVISGVMNMVLDALFMAVFPLGIVGAAAATAISQAVGGIFPLIYFFCKNSSILSLGKTRWYGGAVLRAVTNGSSELMNNVSMSLVGMLYNIQLLNYAGEDGIAAYGVLMYVNYVFISAFLGYSTGSSPIISYHFGANNKGELKSLLKKSLIIISLCSLAMFVLSLIFAYPLSELFVGYDEELLKMTLRGFYIFSISYLLSGFSIFGSGFFTSLGDGLTSAIISFLRTLLFQTLAVVLLPIVLGLDGIWCSIIVAELMSALVTALFLLLKKKKYGYF